MKKQDILDIFNNKDFIEIYLEDEATTRAYEHHFGRLAEIMPIQEGNRILDVGSAHGVPSLSLFEKQPKIEVVALDPATNLLAISRALFKGTNIEKLLAGFAHNGAVLTYLANQHQRCSPHGERISYEEGFAEDIAGGRLEEGLNYIFPGGFNHIMGSLALHWLINPEKAFQNFHELLAKNGTVGISSASWRYRASNPGLDNERRIENAPFMTAFYENLESALDRGKSESSEEPRIWDKSKVEKLLTETGFELIGYSEEKVPFLFGDMLMACKGGAFYSSDRMSSTDSKELTQIVEETLAKTLREEDPFESINHYYEICPYILAKKV